MRRFRKALRPTDVFVVSYPKAGTHWVGFFVASLIAQRAGKPAEVTFKDWQEHVPLLGLLGPDSDRILERENDADPRVFFTHAPWTDCLPRVVYLARDPRDGFVSYFHHQHRTETGFHGDVRQFARDMVKGRVWPCDWADHVTGWLDNPKGLEPLLLRYEDLKTDAAAEFRKLVNFIGLDPTDEQFERALRASSFDRMRSTEKSDGIRGSTGDESVLFMRSGRSTWRESLPPDVAAFLEFAWAPTLSRLYPSQA